MAWLTKLVGGLNKFEKYINLIAVVILVCATFLQVIFRFVLNSPLSWTEELARLCFVWLSVFGTSMALREGRHISFDYLTNKFISKRWNCLRKIMINLILVSFLVYIFMPSLRYVETMNTIPLAGTSWPTGVFFICLPLASIIMVLNLVKEIIMEIDVLSKSNNGGAT